MKEGDGSLIDTRISPYSVRMQEDTDQKNSVFGHISHSVNFKTSKRPALIWLTLSLRGPYHKETSPLIYLAVGLFFS